MKADYKPIGDYIRLVDKRNTYLAVNKLVGLTINKEFIPSVANTIGSDMANYKVIHQNQFACSLMQVRRDKKIPVALYQENEPAIISQAYPVFEIEDTTLLLPEFLMMWFTRSEFDREACFYAIGGVRGSLEWDDFCNMKLPIPSIEKQREIVAEYNAVQRRIELNQLYIQKLEETAQALYRELFIRSKGDNWEMCEIKDFGVVVTGKTPSSKNPQDFGSEMLFITPGDFKDENKFIQQSNRMLSKEGYTRMRNKILPRDTIIVTCIGSDMGKAAVTINESVTNQQINAIQVNQSYYTNYLYYCLTLMADEIKGIALGGSTMPMINKTTFEKIEILKPDDKTLIRFEELIKPINRLNIIHSEEINKLTELQSLVLAKMVKKEDEI